MKPTIETQKVLADIGYHLKVKRESLGLSQEELADRSGLHRTYITDIERGHRNITIQSILRLASALQLSLGELFSGIDTHSITNNSH